MGVRKTKLKFSVDFVALQFVLMPLSLLCPSLASFVHSVESFIIFPMLSMPRSLDARHGMTHMAY